MKVFGFANLESLEIPPSLLNDFCVIGVTEKCTSAILYAFEKTQTHQRVESLILIEPIINGDSLETQLHIIATCGCKIYSYFKSDKKIHLKNYEKFASFGLVIIAMI